MEMAPLREAKGGAVRLSQLRRGMVATVIGFDHEHCEKSVIERMMQLGVDRDLEIEILHEAPVSRDPVVVRVGTVSFALRRREAAFVLVEPVTGGRPQN